MGEMTPGSTAIPSIEAGRDDPLRPVLEIALDAVVVMRADGRIADWNSRSEEIFGWSHLATELRLP
jgi:PAS domain S-box-containing protein